MNPSWSKSTEKTLRNRKALLISTFASLPFFPMRCSKLTADRVVGPFTFRPFPTLRVSPIEIVPKNDGDFRMIHHLSHPTHYSVSDFITIEFCTVKYASIDDAVSLEQRIGKNGKLAKDDIKSDLNNEVCLDYRFEFL
jgi:hypothetical protein